MREGPRPKPPGAAGALARAPGRAGAPAVVPGGGPGGAAGTIASVTAPLPGSPTALRAGPLRPKPPPGPPPAAAIAATVGRVTAAVIPPGQASDAPSAGAVDVNCFSHSIRPRSVSITKTLSELPPTKPSMRKPRYPIKRSIREGGASEFNCFGSFLSLSFHRNWKPDFSPGFCKDSFEIFASALTQDERCASPLFVIQSVPRRPCAFAAPARAAA